MREQMMPTRRKKNNQMKMWHDSVTQNKNTQQIALADSEGFLLIKFVLKSKYLEKLAVLGYNEANIRQNSSIRRVIRQLVGCFLRSQDVEFNHQNEMQGGIYGKENNGQIHIRIAQGKRYDTTRACRQIACV